MIKALTWFIRLWAGVAVLVNLIAISGLLVAGGWDRVAEIYSPSNVVNLIAEIVLISPALVVIYWRDKIKAKRLKEGLD